MNATLNSATVGIENAAGTVGLQVAYNANYVKNNLALQFAAEPDWLSANTASGTLYNGNSVDVVLTFRSEDYPLGTYSMNMKVTSNDPLAPSVTIPIKMTIQLPVQLNLTALIEGLFNGATMVADTVLAELKKPIAPFQLLESKKIALNALGSGSANINSALEGTPYYIVVKHRNGVETWSASPQIFSGGIINYDFSIAQNKAYGNNMVQKGTKWCIYNGDVIRDGFIDGSDVSECFNASLLGLSGYVVTDLTGDDFVDGTDVTIAFNNSNLGIGASYPSKKNPPTKNIQLNNSESKSDK